MTPFRPRLCMLVCAGLLSLAGSAHAATFNLSYVFASGDTVRGTVDGTSNGSFIDDLSNIHLAFDGDAFVGTLSAVTWDPVASVFDASIPARLSTAASINEFLISEATGTYSFGFVNDVALGGQLVFADDLNLARDAASDSPANGSWSITAAAISEPAPLALSIAGLGVVGVAARRRGAR